MYYIHIIYIIYIYTLFMLRNISVLHLLRPFCFFLTGQTQIYRYVVNIKFYRHRLKFRLTFVAVFIVVK